MSKLDAKLLKKMIREMIEESDQQDGLSDAQKDSIRSQLKHLSEENLEEGVKDVFNKLKGKAKKFAAGAALAGALASPAAAAEPSWKAELGVNDTPWQQQIGTGERPVEKKFKFAIISVKSIRNESAKPVELVIDTEGKDLNTVQMQVEAFLASEYGAGKFMVVDIKGSDSKPSEAPEKAGAEAKPVAKKAEIKANDDGTITGTMQFTGDLGKAERLVPDIVQQILLQNPGTVQADIQYVGSKQIKMNPDGKGGTVSQTIKINKSTVKENKVNKDFLRKLILEELQECGMAPMEQEGDLPQEVSSIEIDPDGYEGYMAKGNLYKMGKSATELHNMIQDEENLEPWVEEKIAVAARMIDDVADYMEYAKMAKK